MSNPDSLIIPYQEIIGNYSTVYDSMSNVPIIPYQEIIGNYSSASSSQDSLPIIPYQEIIGNYSWLGLFRTG